MVTLEEILVSCIEHLSMETAPTVTMEMANGKATTIQIIMRVRRVQLSMAFFRKFQ